MARKKSLSKDEKIAVTVLVRTRLIRNWAKGEARFLKIEPSSPGYREFIETQSRELAERVISQQVSD